MNSTHAALIKITGIVLLAATLGACGGGGDSELPSTATTVPLPTAPDTGTGTDPVVGTGVATVNWMPPTEYTDGSTLTNLAGYKIYYGTSLGTFNSVITINNAGITSFMIDNLPAGKTYYFVVTAIDSNGKESNYSAVGTKTIPI
jgi:predicted phage tail protein